jgi:MarR family transcriptional regulator, lower aerobic nicotinate degradation pathway regulator
VPRRRPRAPVTTAAEVRATLDAFRRIVQALRAGARDGERRAGLSSAQLFALQQIADHPGSSINDVAALTYTHQSSVSVVIQRLVARRLVDKVAPSHDRRRQHLELTAAGRRVLRRAPVVVQERLIAALAALPAAERRTLARALGSVAGLVTPTGAAPHPPMLFEERAGGAGRSTSGPRGAEVSSRRRDAR